jgi:WD40 repeat protein
MTCSLGGSVKVWELPSGELECTFSPDERSVRRITITPDGHWAIFAMHTDIQVWYL